MSSVPTPSDKISEPELEPQDVGTEGTKSSLNEAPQYILIVSELSLVQLNATRTFLQSVGLHCAAENYRDGHA